MKIYKIAQLMNQPKYKAKSKYTTFDDLLNILNKLWIDKSSPNYTLLKDRIKNNYYQGNKHHLVNSIQRRQYGQYGQYGQYKKNTNTPYN